MERTKIREPRLPPMMKATADHEENTSQKSQNNFHQQENSNQEKDNQQRNLALNVVVPDLFQKNQGYSELAGNESQSLLDVMVTPDQKPDTMNTPKVRLNSEITKYLIEGPKRQLTESQQKERINYHQELPRKQKQNSIRFWQNNLGTHCVMLEIGQEFNVEKKTSETTLIFRLYNIDCIEIGKSFEYIIDKIIEIENFTLSQDGIYLLMRGGNDYDFFIGTFSNGYMLDLFTEPQQGKEVLDKMFKQIFIAQKEIQFAEDNSSINDTKSHKKDQADNQQHRGDHQICQFEARISKSHHIYLFGKLEPDQQKWIICQSNQSIKEFIESLPIQKDQNENGQQQKLVYMKDDNFSKVALLDFKLVISDPFAIGINAEKEIFFVFNYEDHKVLKNELETNIIQQLKGDNAVLVEPQFYNDIFQWHILVFATSNLYVFNLDDGIIKYSMSYDYPKEVQIKSPFKVIDMQAIICYDEENLKFYKIDNDCEKLEFLSQFQKSKYSEFQDMMKQSSLFYDLDQHQICNYYQTVQKQHFSLIQIEKSDINNKEDEIATAEEQNEFNRSQILGINCFDEVLSNYDLKIFLKEKFPDTDPKILQNITFYSKRLDIAIAGTIKDESYESLDVYSLKNFKELKPLEIRGYQSFIKDINQNGQEVLRIFNINKTQNKIICHTFQENKMEETFFPPENETQTIQKIKVSASGLEVAIFNGQQLTVIAMNQQNQFEVICKQKMIQEFKESNNCSYFEKGLMVIKDKILKFDQDYSKINAQKISGSQKNQQYFELGASWLIFINFYYEKLEIYDINTLQLKTTVTNFDFQESNVIFNFGQVQTNGVFYFHIDNLSSQQHYMTRVQVMNVDQKMIVDVPIKLAFKPNLICVYDMKTKIIDYYPMNKDFKMDQLYIVSRIKLRYHLDPLLEIADIHKYLKLLDREKEVIDNIQNSLLIDLTSYNVLHKTSYMCSVQEKTLFSRFIPHILKRLQILPNREVMPYLICEDKQGSNPLKKAIQNKDTLLATNILQLCITGDKYGQIYPEQINPLLFQMKNIGVDLKPYFNSQLAYHRVDEQNKNFATYDTDPDYGRGFSLKDQLFDVLEFESCFPKEDKNDQEQNDQQYKIEYNVVNLKEVIEQARLKEDEKEVVKSNESYSVKKMIQVIDDLSDTDLSFLEIEVLQVIVDYKWITFTKHFFIWQFVFLIIFLTSFITDLVIGSNTFGLAQNKQLYGFIATRVICQLVLFRFILFEISQFRTIKAKEYISSGWNIFEILLHLTYTTYFVLSFVDKSQLYAIKSLQSCIILFTFIKFIFYLRIYPKFSFLVQMLINVFTDMSYFLYFFGFVIGFFSIFLGILVNDLKKYEGIGPVGFFAIALRTSIGDYDFDSYVSNSDYDILTWVVWLLIMIVGNVVFMNFIIAVVGQSYENCMQQMTAQSYKVKVHMIRERESVMTGDELTNEQWFPNYIIVRKPLIDGRDVQNGEAQNEWKGLLREVQKGVKRQIDALKEDQKKVNAKMENEIMQIQKMISDKEAKAEKIMQEIKDLLTKKDIVVEEKKGK